ncbi:hypothetical protein GCM10022225_82510 [Plantactinospora mayteni]|uniref:IrrE N-terminal-like domain-containing protein n=1 Tax=Plantactinospora mayteni TaxID=566021 RepID=A0ABQ4F444_9ACTN|nr:hypothetical protein [Plantactinospora mayteni]GIH01668.1 hypothetical protein Pma05_82400 [Plantactinospora mayteni]
MTDSEAAQRFLEQLRAQTRAAFGIPPDHFDYGSYHDDVIESVLSTWTPEDQRDQQLRARLEQEVRGIHSYDEYMSGVLAKMQVHLAEIAAKIVSGVSPPTIHVGHLETGQLNAASILVPGHNDTYLAVFEDQLWMFAKYLSTAVALTIPGYDTPDGMFQLTLANDDIAARLKDNKEIGDLFGAGVLNYVVKGKFTPQDYPLSPGHRNFAYMLETGLEYFVLAHEYGHVILSHPDGATRSRSMLPVSDVEALAYSWGEEYDADLFGMLLAYPACSKYFRLPFEITFMGISLFFDALEIIDRAVALLETGDENILQVGSHPPRALRLKHLRANLPHLVEAHPSMSDDIEAALKLADIQRKAIDMLWEHCRPTFAGLRKYAGIRAHPKWRIFRKEP